MKSSTTILLVIAALGSVVESANSATQVLVSADDNGTIGSNTLGGSNSLAVGSNNSISFHSSLAVGSSNDIEAPNSVVFGTSNYAGQYDNEDSIFVTGAYNSSVAWASILGGSYNAVDWLAYASITAGAANYNNARSSLMIGTGNVSSSSNCPNSIIGGQYNTIPIEPALLILGNGTEPANRRNAMVVYADGDVDVHGAITSGGSPILTQTSAPSYLSSQGFITSTSLASMGAASTSAGQSSSWVFGSAAIPADTSYSYIFGQSNTLSTGWNFVWGKSNNLDAAENLVLGNYNDLHNANLGYVIGSSNVITSDTNSVIGSRNHILQYDGEGSGNSVFGSGNLLGGVGMLPASDCFVLGSQNVLHGHTIGASVLGKRNQLTGVGESIVIGHDHSLTDKAATLVLGNNSAPLTYGDPWIEGSGLLTIGNGNINGWVPPGGATSFNYQPSNALEIHSSGKTTLRNRGWSDADPLEEPSSPYRPSEYYGHGQALVVEGHTQLRGRVVIDQPQGDISMGIYGE